MLEKLDSIDWAGMQWSKIPDAIRRLQSDDPAARNDALDRLIDIGSHESITAATPFIMPFLFELLEHHDTPDKAQILDRLEVVLEEADEKAAASEERMRRNAAINQSFNDHVPLLLRLVEHNEEPVRLAALGLLRGMDDSDRAIAQHLLELLAEERNEDVAIRMAETLRSLWWPAAAHPAALPLLRSIIAGHASARVRVAAARAAVRCADGADWLTAEVLEIISGLLAREVITQTTMFEREYPDAHHTRELLADILRLPNAQDVVLEVLRDPAIAVEQAHLAGSALIALAHRQAEDWHTKARAYSHGKQGFVYRAKGQREPLMDDRVRSALAQLVEIDVFWAVQSNLLSARYGLPNGRKKLRALLNMQ